MNRMILSGALVALSAAAYAEPTLVDTLHVTKDGVTTQLARYQDPSNGSCTEYGLLTVAGKGGNDSKTICGASNILAAKQGDHDVVYIYARDVSGGLNLYRYMVATKELVAHEFKANELEVLSMGTEVMVRATYPDGRKSFTWHPLEAAPKAI